MDFVLVVDDNRQTAEAVSSILKLWGFQTRQAISPGSAMTVLGVDTPIFITLDINMPGLDGFEVLSFLQREPRLANVPVIVVTSDDQPETREKAIHIGAKEVVIKPVMPDAMEEALKKIGIL